MDQETAYLNEQGENSHAKYKKRQRDRVSDRLMWGLLRDGKEKKAGKPVAKRTQDLSPLELAMTDSHPPGRDAPRREPRLPRPELPSMPPASDEPTLPTSTTVTGALVPEGFGLDEDSMLEPHRGRINEVSLADENTLVGEITEPRSLPE